MTLSQGKKQEKECAESGSRKCEALNSSTSTTSALLKEKEKKNSYTKCN
jgi:hypothetical protein